MTTPDPRGYPKCSALARLDLAVQGPHQHWTFDDEKRTHKSLPTNGRLAKRAYQGAVEHGMSYTIKCMANPLRGNLKQDTLRARRTAILNSL